MIEKKRESANQGLLWIVDDDNDFAQTLKLEFKDRGYKVRVLNNTEAVSFFLQEEKPDYAIVDLRLLGESGLASLRAITEATPHCQAVLLTGYGSIPTAVEAMKYGAVDYLTKPVNVDHMEAVLKGQDHLLPAVTYQIDGAVESKKEDPESQGETLARHEREYIEYVLAQCDGNISKAAKWLGIHRQSLQRKLKKYPPP